MQKKDFEAVAEALKRVQHKTTAAIKDFIRDLDESTENAALAGKRLTARARITALFDEGTFVETGAFIKRRATEFDADAVSSDDFEAVITGYGAVGGKLVYAFAEDHFRSKGAVGEAHAKKICSLYDMAVANGAPVVGIFDSDGAFVLEGVSALGGYGRIMSSVSRASGVIPQIAVIAGTCAGSAAVIASMFDITILSGTDGKFYVGSNIAEPSVKCDDEISAIGKAQQLIELLPSNNCDGTVRNSFDANGKIDVSFIEDSGYDAHNVINAIADGGKSFEFYADTASEMITSIASVGGIVSAIVATNPASDGGKLSSKGARKASKLISLADAFDIPVITLVDTLAIDRDNAPDASELAKLAFAYTEADCPKVTVITGNAYGTAYTLLGSKSVGADVAFALNTAKIAALSAESAVALLFDDKFEGAADPAARRAELCEEWNSTFGSAVEAAYKGEIDDVIESSELRARIASALEMLSMKNAGEPGRRHIALPF